MRRNYLFVPLLLVSVGLNIFLFLRKPSTTKNTSITNTTYHLINPLAQEPIDSENEHLILHYVPLKPKIEEMIAKVTNPENVGFFLQDAKTGSWLGFNEKEQFYPASLLKIPIMMAIFKEVDRGELQLTDKLTLQKEDLEGESGTMYLLGEGKELTYWELIEAMILSSDNTAKNALKRKLTTDEINAVFAHVGIPNPYSDQSEHTLTPRGYTRLFKSLYFSTFLSPELSEKALDVTTDTQMESLLSAGVPSEVQVAHKFGYAVNDILSDCGIVYYPNSPYFLCIMVRQTELDKAKELIGSLSKLVYEYVSSGENPSAKN